MYVSNKVAELMQMQLSVAEMDLLAAEVWVLARKMQEEQKIQRRQKENVCGRDLGFLEDRSMVSMKSR